jgi:nicotinate-nucleotide adenylyltransferase
MARINFSHLPTDPFPQDVTLHLCELERAQRNPSVPSYAYDTLKELGSSLNDLAFVIGTDQLIQFHRWHRFVDLLSLSHWIVLDRKPSNEAAMKTLQEWKASGLIQPSLASNSWLIRNSLKSLTLVPTNAPSLSSTAIREEIVRTGNPPENSLLSGVLGYLKVHRLYGMKPTL